jgi:hypothetical protein
MHDNDLIDLFAGLAMQGYIARGYQSDIRALAEDSYSIAYAMIKEKEKRLVRERTFAASSN